jgi:hypothetical protein
MSKVGEEIEVLPLKFDDDGYPVVVEEGSKSGTSKTPTLEDLMKKLDKLKATNKRLKAKGKKGTKYSSSSEDGDSSFEEEVSNKGEKGETSTISLLTILFLSIIITYQILPLTLLYPLANLPVLMGQTITNRSIA